MPNVVGMNEEDAGRTLREEGLYPEVVGDTTGEARVYSQKPAAGTEVTRSSTVGIRFLAEGDPRSPSPRGSPPAKAAGKVAVAGAPPSRNSDPVLVMPTLTGNILYVAKNLLRMRFGPSHYKIEFSSESEPEAPAMLVVRQSPLADAKVKVPTVEKPQLVRLTLKARDA